MNSSARQPIAGSRQGGFTIIELLVSLTILGVILALLSGGLKVISNNWEAHAKRIEAFDMLSRAADILRRDAAGMQRLVAVTRGRNPHFVFTGSETHLSFVTLEPPYPSAPGPYFVDYSVERNGPNLDLIRARAPYSKGMQAFPGATPANRVRLVQGPYRYQFAYAEKADAGGWRNSWPSATRLPNLIRLQVVNAHNVPVIASQVVALRADAELSCLAEKSKVCSAKSGGELRGQAGKAPNRNQGNSKDEDMP